MRAYFISFGILLAVALLGVGAFVYSGSYSMAADDPHWDVTSRIIRELRVRSLERRARQVGAVPNLEDQQLIARGAGQYAAMCVGCHLAPGIAPTELSKGLYPEPPLLSRGQLDPRVSYTVIRHGIKMTGMPAWGDHGDEQVWSLVAFVAKLPGMTPQQYQAHISSPAAGAAAAMKSHDMGAMPQMPDAGANGSAGAPAGQNMMGKEPMTTGEAASGAHGPPGHHAPASGQAR